MVYDHGQVRRPVFWEGSAKADFKAFPIPIQKDMGVALFIVQIGGMPPAAKPWYGLGAGVFELAEDHAGGTYRCVYIVRFADAVHVLHAFQKKSKRGRKTPRPDVELVERRLKALIKRRQEAAELGDG